jgi:hypothetical protein
VTRGVKKIKGVSVNRGESTEQDIKGSIPVERARDIALARSTNSIEIILVREAFVALLAPSILSIWGANNGVTIFI